MKVTIGFSTHSNARDAVDECCAEINGSPRLLVFFAEPNLFLGCTKRLKELYADCTVVGGTTYMAISSRGCDKQGVSLIALYDDIDCAAGLIPDVHQNPMAYANIVRECRESVGNDGTVCCLEMTTALMNGEELVQDVFSSVLDDSVMVFGGSTGNGVPTETMYVSLNGEVYSEGCVFVFIRTQGKVRFYRENMFKPTACFFKATDVDCETRTVYEFDNTPAAMFIAEALGTTKDKLPEVMPLHPLGRLINDEVFIADFKSLDEEDSMSWYARIYNYTKLALLELDDFERVFAETIQRVQAELPKHSFAFVINCSSRSKFIEARVGFEALKQSLDDGIGTYVGFSGYGEQLGFRHLNQTMVLAVFE